MVGVPRFEVGEPCRQSPHDWPTVIGLKIFGIKIKGNIGRPKLIEGFRHPAAILLPSRQMASRKNSESHQSTKG
jgi:hypothetical protein